MKDQLEKLLREMRNRQNQCADEARGLEEQSRSLRIEESTFRHCADLLSDVIKESPDINHPPTPPPPPAGREPFKKGG